MTRHSEWIILSEETKSTTATTNFTGVPPFPGGSTTSAAASPGGSPTTTGGSVFDPGNLISFTNLATSAINGAQGTNIYLAAGATLSSVVHALDSTGRFKVISRPMVFTSNNKKAIIANGQEIPVPVSTLSNATVPALPRCLRYLPGLESPVRLQ